jgi:hypothetical protein
MMQSIDALIGLLPRGVSYVVVVLFHCEVVCGHHLPDWPVQVLRDAFENSLIAFGEGLLHEIVKLWPKTLNRGGYRSIRVISLRVIVPT